MGGTSAVEQSVWSSASSTHARTRRVRSVSHAPLVPCSSLNFLLTIRSLPRESSNIVVAELMRAAGVGASTVLLPDLHARAPGQHHVKRRIQIDMASAAPAWKVAWQQDSVF
jgi:hypothetical protein